VSTAQPALAWLHQGPDVVPIPGTRDPDRIAEYAAAAAIGLSEEELRRIEEIAAPGTAVGAALI
jgi:aryl-alcohol dehydrogenase-like predicted oxidoreductase